MYYKKMAGTAAVFIYADQHANSPVERDGMVWQASELKLDSLGAINTKPAMASTLALEGLEDYDPPNHGDCRQVSALDANFVYVEPIKGWVEYTQPA